MPWLSLPIVAAVAFGLAGTASASPDAALPRELPVAYAKNGYEVKWKSGGCKYKYKSGKKGFKEEMKCK